MPPHLKLRFALRSARQPADLDLICTDPPYYDAIPYSDLMDFFHVWYRRVLQAFRAKQTTPSRRN